MAKKKVDSVEEEVKEEGPTLTYLGPGPLSGGYRFAEIPGTIAAVDEADAWRTAREIALKHPDLLIK